MAKIDIPGLRPKRTAAGIRYYWEPSATMKKAGWKPMPLGADPLEAHNKAEARNKEVAAWREGGARPREVKAYVTRATVDGLIQAYKDAGYPRLKQGGRGAADRFVAESTRYEYDSKFRVISAWAGSEPVLAITRKNVETLRDGLMEPDKKGRIRHNVAHGTLRVLRTLLKFGVKKGLIEKNPAESFDLAAPPPREQVASIEAREALLEVADAAGEPNFGLAMLLGWKIAQREGDLLKTLQTQYAEIPPYKMDAEVYAALSAMAPDGRVMGIRVRQGKTKVWIEVPVVNDERDRIERAIAGARELGLTTILYDERDKVTWTSGETWERKKRQMYFQRRFADHRENAAVIATQRLQIDLADELRNLQFRDFRRTCVVVLGELGLADQLIAAITGHSLDETKRILEIYMPRTTGMAARAIMLSAERDARQATRGKQG